MPWCLIRSCLVVFPTAVTETPSSNEVCSAVITVTVEPRHRSFSGLARCFNTFGVSYWCFLDSLFHRYWPCSADVASPLPLSHHNRWRASSDTSAATLGSPACPPGRVERVGAELGAGDLAVDEEISRSAPPCPVGAADMRALDVSERERTVMFWYFLNFEKCSNFGNL